MTIGFDFEKSEVTPEVLPQDVVMGDPAFPSILSVCSLSETVTDPNTTGQQESTSHNEQNNRKRKIEVDDSNPRSQALDSLRSSRTGESKEVPVIITLDDDDEAEENHERSSPVQSKKTKLSDAASLENIAKNSTRKVLSDDNFLGQNVESNIPAPESDDDIQILDDFTFKEDYNAGSGSGSSSSGSGGDSSTSDENDDGKSSKKTSSGSVSSSGSSSTSSSDEGGRECAPLGRKLGELFGQISKEREVEDLEDRTVPLDDENVEDSNVELNERGQMKCRVCPTVFKSKIRYLIHKRRHFAPDHFICPTCLKGFIKFSHCQDHEMKEHHHESSSENASYAFRARNANNFNETEDLNGEDLSKHIVVSSSLYPYRGPPVEGAYTPYEIELKYSRSERKSHATIAAKYTLECQRRRKLEAASQLAQRNKSEVNAKRMSRASSVSDHDDRATSDEDLGSDSEYVPDLFKQIKKTNKKKPTLTNTSLKEQKWFYCDLCEYQGCQEQDIQKHARLRHSNVPVSEVVKCLSYDPNNLKKSSQGKTETKTKAVRKTRQSSPAPVVTSRSGNLAKSIPEPTDKKIKKKKPKVPKERRRVWETKHRKRPKQVEFLFALGLVKKSDVIIGPRDGTSAVVSSLYRKRKGRRDRSLSPGARIVMKKLPDAKNKTYRVCPYCEFFAVSKSDIRRHRGEVHGARPVGGVSRPKKSFSQTSPKKDERRNSEGGEPTPSTSTASTTPCVRKCPRCSTRRYFYSKYDYDAHIRDVHAGQEKVIRTVARKFIH